MSCKDLTRSIETIMSSLIMSWKNYFEAKMAKYSIRTITMGAVLFSVYKHPGVVQDDICKMLNMDKAYVTRELNSLSRLSYIKREKDNIDHRKNHVYVTDDGREAAETIEAVRCDWSAIEFTGISDEEKKSFLDILNKVQTNVRDKALIF